MTQALSKASSTLTEQHEHIKSMMAKVADGSGEERQAAFNELRRFLAAHEAAEEACIHPVANEEGGGGATVAQQRLEEEDEAGKAITALEALDVDSSDFTSGIQALTKSVIAHAEAEEHQEFPLLDGVIDADQVQRIRRALARVPELAASTGRSGSAGGGSFKDILAAAKAQFTESG